MKEARCLVCGGVFISYKQRTVCSNECRNIRDRQIQQKYRDTHKSQNREREQLVNKLTDDAFNKMMNRKPRRLFTEKEVAEKFDEAVHNNLGLSYGYYIGYRDTGYLEKYRKIKEREKNEDM